jgi:hypothetical protein
MHDGYTVVLTLEGGLADTGLAVHLLEVKDYMEVLIAILSLGDSWAYMEVDPVVPHHSEVVEKQVHK